MHDVHDAEPLHDVLGHHRAVPHPAPRHLRQRQFRRRGNEDFLRDRGVEVEVMNVPEMVDYFAEWMAKNPEIWNGYIGV
jgi:hypothetical protein